jgi:hypothetical protein
MSGRKIIALFFHLYGTGWRATNIFEIFFEYSAGGEIIINFNYFIELIEFHSVYAFGTHVKQILIPSGHFVFASRRVTAC